jgi:hypothetical protein
MGTSATAQSVTLVDTDIDIRPDLNILKVNRLYLSKVSEFLCSVPSQAPTESPQPQRQV